MFRKCYFTLIEILVTITIIVILMALGVAGVSKVLEAQAMRKCVMQVDIIESAIESYYAKYGDYPQLQSDWHIDASDLEEFINFSKAGINVNANNRIVDPWGIVYNYSRPGGSSSDPNDTYMYNINGFDLWSNGPDRLTRDNKSRGPGVGKFDPNHAGYYKNFPANVDDIGTCYKRH